MNEFHCDSNNRYPLLIRIVQLTGRKSEQRPYALAPTQNGVAHRFMQAFRRDVCDGKQALQGIFDAYLMASRPILEISGHQYQRGRNFSACWLQGGVPVAVHPAAWSGNIVAIPSHACELRG